MTRAPRIDDDPDESASSPAYICGYPTSRAGGACQHPVAHPGGRCHHHPRTVLEPTDDVADTTGDYQ